MGSLNWKHYLGILLILVLAWYAYKKFVKKS